MIKICIDLVGFEPMTSLFNILMKEVSAIWASAYWSPLQKIEDYK